MGGAPAARPNKRALPGHPPDSGRVSAVAGLESPCPCHPPPPRPHCGHLSSSTAGERRRPPNDLSGGRPLGSSSGSRTGPDRVATAGQQLGGSGRPRPDEGQGRAG